MLALDLVHHGVVSFNSLRTKHAIDGTSQPTTEVQVDELQQLKSTLDILARPNVSLIQVFGPDVVLVLRIVRVFPRFDADEDRAIVVPGDAVLEHIVPRVTAWRLDDVVLDLVSIRQSLHVDPLNQTWQVIRSSEEFADSLSSNAFVSAMASH